ncbi:hydroxymethylbilane synthase [Ahrensia sp. 13_GOM-1096m]|uniref:hydroxymethylbilane synthase n=1 Tax=Ahrensia sp. 13_GOM-1096m TaxID=1380380 RepID=UPI0006861656|nr:hydroxymethylbilane synthase [Ahrensia sp. 13_GOM-1096m]
MQIVASTPQKIGIGTRGSPLALAQAHEVRDRLIAAHGSDAVDIEIHVISVVGDRVQDRSLSEIGGKGLFTEEIEAQLSSGDIDIAVHSSKDMPTKLPDGLALIAFLEREDPRDAFISHSVKNILEMPEGAVLGTSSLRRQALALRARPDLKTVGFRGNVQTRLKKLSDGVADATLLASAGLRRLGMIDIAADLIDMSIFPPAPGQGAICVEGRIGDQRVLDLIEPLRHQPTEIALVCERTFLATLDGSCRTPIAAYATIDGDHISFNGTILRPDGTEAYDIKMEGRIGEAAEIGMRAGAQLRATAGDDFFKDWQ